MAEWACPRCGAEAGEHGKGGRGKCRQGVAQCEGLLCECDDEGGDSHGTAEDPCPNANCYHCDWGGTFPSPPAVAEVNRLRSTQAALVASESDWRARAEAAEKEREEALGALAAAREAIARHNCLLYDSRSWPSSRLHQIATTDPLGREEAAALRAAVGWLADHDDLVLERDGALTTAGVLRDAAASLVATGRWGRP